jgi:arylsulfatase A-like enzyme
MDRAIPFMESAAQRGQPFFAVIRFNALPPPVVAGAEHRRPCAGQPVAAQGYFGSISALDEQAGRLRAKLRDLGVEQNTILWYAGGNSPEGIHDAPADGTAGPFRGPKQSLYEGGVRAPGILIWPEKIQEPRVTGVPCSTSDWFPTILEAAGVQLRALARPIDGISLMPLIAGSMTSRPRPIGFETPGQVSLTGNRYKIYAKTGEREDAAPFELYDLIDDPGERHDLAAERPAIVRAMAAMFADWCELCRASSGRGYRAPGEFSRLPSRPPG